MSTVTKTKTSIQTYLLDPAKAGVSLDTPGNPTAEGWKVVTPEMWKFRFEVDDKAMTQAPDFFRDKEWYLDATKADMLAKIFENNPDIHPADLQAESFCQYLDTQQINIRPNDHLLGGICSDTHGIHFDPLGYPWTSLLRCQSEAGKERVIVWEGDKKVALSDEKFERLEKLAKNFNTVFKVRDEFTDDEFKMYYCEQPGRYFEPVGSAGLRANPDHDWYLPLGLNRIMELKQKRMEQFELELSMDGTSAERKAELEDHIINSKASIKSVQGVSRWIKRHATEGRAAADKMPDETSKATMLQAADNCDWVAENAPRTFWEAMQLYWSCFLADYCIETSCTNITFRPDRVFWDWYEKDVIQDKSLTREKAAEILCTYAAKFHEVGIVSRFGALGMGTQGARDASAITIGGLNADGSSCVNDLTMLVLDVWDGYRFHHPDCKFRWNNKTKKEDFRRLIAVMRSGMGSPSIRNDEIVIPAFLSQYPGQITLEEAREWGIVGCITPGPTTNSKGACRRDANYPQVLKAVEFALFNGRDPDPEFSWVKAAETGDPKNFKEFDAFYYAWLKQWEWVVRTEVKFRNRVYEKMGQTLRRPFLSALYKGCLETGLDVMNYPMPRYSFQSIVGMVDTIDSLAAVNQLVFIEKKYTMAQLVEAIKTSWVGFEDMQQDFIDAPKFGNDIKMPDDIMIRVNNDISEIGRTNFDIDGNPVYPSLLPISMIWQAAGHVGALPNGRVRGQALCDGGLNPQAEYDHSGSWARLNSALKIDQAKLKAYIYNHRFDYGSVAGESGLDKMVNFASAGLNGGMQLMQFNVVSSEILGDAKENPEKYPYLSVRVSGYTAFFVGLPEFMQDTIMARVDHKL